nr:MAG TPA: hypothetical protein [Caudoviricetes sp.]
MATASVRLSCIKNNHSKGHFLIPILPKSEVIINVDGRTSQWKV